MIKSYKCLFLLVFFLNLVISNAMADGATWPAQSTWDTTFNRATIIVKDGTVTGIYDWNDGRFYKGQISNDGKTITGYFIEYQTFSNDILREGKYSFTIAPDGKAFGGKWSTNLNGPLNEWSEMWFGTLVSSSNTITVHLNATWPVESVWEDVDGNKITIEIKNSKITGTFTGRPNGKLDGNLSADGKFIS